jgi:hypothetical protein
MNVFISWSGELSRELGEALHDWLQSVLQRATPFFAPDIEKGARWGDEITKQLDTCGAGIFCLTEENLAKPWIMFEAGALSRNGGRVCPILFNVDPRKLEGPLQQFQAAPFCRDEMCKLLRTLNADLGADGLQEPVLERVFDKWWPELDAQVRHIIQCRAGKPATEKPAAGDRLQAAAAPSMIPPPRHTSPSYSTADWPGVTAHCGSSKLSTNRSGPSDFTVHGTSAWR